MEQMSGYTQLNQFIFWFIQNNGISYVVDNYIGLREQYYCLKTT